MINLDLPGRLVTTDNYFADDVLTGTNFVDIVYSPTVSLSTLFSLNRMGVNENTASDVNVSVNKQRRRG